MSGDLVGGYEAGACLAFHLSVCCGINPFRERIKENSGKKGAGPGGTLPALLDCDCGITSVSVSKSGVNPWHLS